MTSLVDVSVLGFALDREDAIPVSLLAAVVCLLPIVARFDEGQPSATGVEVTRGHVRRGHPLRLDAVAVHQELNAATRPDVVPPALDGEVVVLGLGANPFRSLLDVRELLDINDVLDVFDVTGLDESQRRAVRHGGESESQCDEKWTRDHFG